MRSDLLFYEAMGQCLNANTNTIIRTISIRILYEEFNFKTINILRGTKIKILSDEFDFKSYLPSLELAGKHCHHPDDQSVAPLAQLLVGVLGDLPGGLPGGLPGSLLGGLLGGLLGVLLGVLPGGLLGGLPGGFPPPNVRVPQTTDSPSP